MRILKLNIVILLVFVAVFNTSAQTDTLLIDSLNTLAKKYIKIDYDSSLIYAKKAENLSKPINYQQGLSKSYYWQATVYKKMQDFNKTIVYAKKAVEQRKTLQDTLGLAKAYSKIGLSYFSLNKFDSALYYQNKCLNQYLLTNNARGKAIAYNNIGSVLINLGNYKEAILKFQKALNLFEEIDMQNGVASCMLNIGQIYDLMGNRKDTVQNNKALDYYSKALKTYKNIKDDFKIAQTYNAIGIQYDQKAAIYAGIAKVRDTINSVNTVIQSDIYYQKAISTLSKGLDIYRKIDYNLGVAQITNNIGTIYMNQGKFQVALKYLYLSLNANIESNNDKEIATSRLSIASCYYKMQEYKTALEHLNKGFEYVKKIDMPILYQNYYEEYALVYNNLKSFENAYKYHVRYTNIKDSLLKADNLTTINEVQALYKNEIQEKQLQLSEAQIKAEKVIANKRKMQIYAISGFALLLIILAIIILRSLRQRKKSHKILEEKNEHITQQQTEITASITYASRIQRAVLPQKNYTDKLFKEHFILYKPQHIVSGDFFWIKEINNIVVAVAADCTGHGVPGAFMSMLGLSFLNEISNKKEIKSTAQILNELRKSVINSLHQTGKEGEQKDGMDIAIIAWHKKENYIEFSGANNPLYLIKTNKIEVTNNAIKLIDNSKLQIQSSKFFYEVKPDKMPIGIHVKNDDFTSTKIEIQEDDQIYLFSDGYADQFGGPKGKKFKYKPFKKLLLENSHLPMEIQKQMLDKSIEDWKAFINPHDNEPYSQIDDVLVIGIKF